LPLIVFYLYLIETWFFHSFFLLKVTTLWVPLHEFFKIVFFVSIFCILPNYKRIILGRFLIFDPATFLLVYFSSYSIWKHYKKVWGKLYLIKSEQLCL
jgi:hypothetical protein